MRLLCPKKMMQSVVPNSAVAEPATTVGKHLVFLALVFSCDLAQKLLNIELLAAVFFLVMFQRGLCYIAKTTGSLYSQMNPIEFWVGGGMVNQCD
jgi:hypothetical protein